MKHRVPAEEVGGMRVGSLIGKMDKVYMGLATIPRRQDNLDAVVGSVINQVDRLFVMLNNFDGVPKCLVNKKVTVFRSQRYKDYGGAGKFFTGTPVEGYRFTIDDDILYPDDYVKRMVDCIEKYERDAVVTVQARIINPKAKSYSDRKRRNILFKFANSLDKDTLVHIPGSGTMAYHTARCNIHPSDFEKRNMDDIVLAARFNDEDIPVISIARDKNWLQRLPDHGWTVWGDLMESKKGESDPKKWQELDEIFLSTKWRRLGMGEKLKNE